jgi:hypothetical protein
VVGGMKGVWKGLWNNNVNLHTTRGGSNEKHTGGECFPILPCCCWVTCHLGVVRDRKYVEWEVGFECSVWGVRWMGRVCGDDVCVHHGSEDIVGEELWEGRCGNDVNLHAGEGSNETTYRKASASAAAG